MNSPWKNLSAPKIAIALTLLVTAFAASAFPQAGTSQVEPIDTDSLIIAMDNQRQGNNNGACTGPAFNIRAYGLAVRLLYANIPLKWAIGDKTLVPLGTPNKNNPDFTASVTQLVGSQGGGVNVGGQTCGGTASGGPTTPFAGGPIIIPVQYRAAALGIITTFNNGQSNDNDVRIYEVDADFVAPIRYTLSHKPFVAVGPEGSGGTGFGTTVYRDILVEAGLEEETHWDFVANNVIATNSCVTLAAQAHASSTAINFIGTYRSFAESGGNLMLQCESVRVFENATLAQGGRFQTSNGWTIFGTNGGEVDSPVTAFPNPAMPFSQFVGDLADEQGLVSEYQRNGGTLQNGTQPVAENSGGAGTSYVATVSKIGNASAGGNVFELGGHDYDISNNGNTAIQRANGERMMLNTLLVPAFRAGCPGVSFNSVKAFKSVKMFTDINSDGLPNFGDTVEWTLRYINEGTSTVTNFQITDPIDAKLTYVAGSISAIASPNPATTVGVNGSYNPNTNINMLVPATSKIGPNGIITVKFRTVVNGFGLIANQGTGTGTGITGSVKTDTTDSTTTGTVANYPIACPVTPCLSQAGYQTGSNEDPTKFDLGTAPSAGPALVSGKVLDEGGRGLRSVSVVLQNASTGAVRSAVTNTFGNFSFAEVPAGDLYIISVSSKRYVFAPDSIAFQVNDNVAGLTFNVAPTGPVIQLPTVGKTAAAVPAKVSKY